MKTIPPPCPVPDTGPKYWRSLDHLAETPAFREWMEREFPAGASELTDAVSRRHFVKIMGASFLLAGVGLTGCRRPEEKILPFGKMPEGYVHGVPQHYATAMPTRGGAIPLLVKSHEGRPIKVEGNPGHPDSNGGTDTFAQASILDLYDPDRAQVYRQGNSASTRGAATALLDQVGVRLRATRGQGTAFLLSHANSPSRDRLLTELKTRVPNARFYGYEAVDLSVDQQAATVAFGKPVRPYYKLDQAGTILSLDCDFIGSEEDTARHIRGFAKSRRSTKPEDPLSRLYVVEGLMTQTGANADHRLRIAPSQIAAVAAALAEKLLGAAGAELTTALKKAGGLDEKTTKWVNQCAAELAKDENKGKSLVLAGHRQPLAVHLAAQAINGVLGNVGKTVVYHDVPGPALAPLADLARDAGTTNTIIIVGGNPAYNAPAEWAAISAGKTILRLSYYEDETAAALPAGSWHLPLAHYLESWGDARTSDGTVVPVQPLLAPLYGGMTELEMLARLAGLPSNPYDIARDTFRAELQRLSPNANFEEEWKKFLHEGYLADSAAKPAAVEFKFPVAAQAATVAPINPPSKDSLEVVFHRDYKVDDGRYNNNGWLQELPDPISKMVWENVILMSKATADALGLFIRDKEDLNLQVPVVRVSVGTKEIEGPAWIQPGMADNVLGFALGYGRTKTGRVGTGTGYNAYAARTATTQFSASAARVTDTGRRHLIVSTQNHWIMEGRPIVREGTAATYRKQPDFAKAMDMHQPLAALDAEGHPLPLYPNPLDIPGSDGKSPRDRATHAWGMSIDLSACVGCSACMLACQSENNIPIVGKDLVNRGREMHWIRIDRYYTGGVDDPQVANQPMLCQHCESAPCENVCPVNATAHDEEGLNVMAYNRCVGTRYCSNNCPYKVRRFNYLDYNRRPLTLLKGPVFTSPLVHRTDTGSGKEWDLARWWRDVDSGLRPPEEWELLKLVKNPDVTVRMRGVMEKCSFCIQRIEQAKIAQKVKAGPTGDVEVPDGTIKTACQQACPAEAIVFGNIKDPNSRVSQLKRQPRDYSVLEFLLTKPRTTYLARIRNPDPAMPDYHEKPLSLVEWEEKGNSLEAHHGAAAGHGAEKKGAQH